MLPVRCCSEKINICRKVQIDDKEPSLSLHLIQSKAWAHMTHEKEYGNVKWIKDTGDRFVD